MATAAAASDGNYIGTYAEWNTGIRHPKEANAELTNELTAVVNQQP
jgi:hypothetical protein